MSCHEKEQRFHCFFDVSLLPFPVYILPVLTSQTMATFAILQKELQSEIKGVNRYNPNNIPKLEACINLMTKENQYDKDILLTVLKLYQLNPTNYNESIVCQVLLKTMMVFPHNDYALAKYLIDANRINTPELRKVTDIGALLESCNFGVFWRLMRGDYKPDDKFKTPQVYPAVIEPITGFEDAVRNFACQVISVTFQRIEKSELNRLLGNISDAQLLGYAKVYNWNPQPDGILFIQNHEDTIKSRNIEEKLRFEQCIELFRSVK
uniref:Eukaryotic translation initiation factor 3 subunit K n=1 Tax=Panagrellus redivivus TaxID=6233 RepID=A0A7E4URK0_PANRE